MADKNFLIGIGGTGSRVIESILMMCAAGNGPDELTVFIVDPDVGNGNLQRTKNLIDRYMNCRHSLKDSVQHLFRTEIKVPDPLFWDIFEKNSKSLAGFINYESIQGTNANLASFVDLLFTPDELALELDQGFKGHPAIGSVVMSQANLQVQPWKTLSDAIAASAKENDIRLFLVGSIFGGTGAAGIPTFGAPGC